MERSADCFSWSWGAWGALIPFIGPYFGLTIGSDQTWDWSSGRLWLSVVPGVVAFVGGFLLLTSAHRAGAAVGAWLAIAAGAWFVVGPTVSRLWNDGTSAAGAPAGDTNRQVLELLTMFEGLGVLIAVLGAFALGRLAVRGVRDAELAREADLERERETAHEDTAAAAEDERFHRDRPVARRRPVAERSGVTDSEPPSMSTGSGASAAAGEEPTRIARTSPPPADAAAPTERAGAVRADPMSADNAPAETRRSGGLLGRLRRS